MVAEATGERVVTTLAPRHLGVVGVVAVVNSNAWSANHTQRLEQALPRVTG